MQFFLARHVADLPLEIEKSPMRITQQAVHGLLRSTLAGRNAAQKSVSGARQPGAKQAVGGPAACSPSTGENSLNAAPAQGISLERP
jgi:hypothetical protein